MVYSSSPINQSAVGGGKRQMLPLKGSDFAGALGRAMKGMENTETKRPLAAMDFVPGAKAAGGRQQELTRTAQKWVAQTFYGAMLKQMRNSPFKSELFEGGRGGEAFQSMFDQTLADRMARGQNNKLVRSIVRQILKRKGRKEQGGAGENAHQAATGSQENPFEKVRVHVAPTR